MCFVSPLHAQAARVLLQQTTIDCNRLQHTLKHTATHCNTMHYTEM